GLLLLGRLRGLGHARQLLAVHFHRPDRLNGAAAFRSGSREEEGLAVRGHGQAADGIGCARQLPRTAADVVEVDLDLYLAVDLAVRCRGFIGLGGAPRSVRRRPGPAAPVTGTLRRRLLLAVDALVA